VCAQGVRVPQVIRKDMPEPWSKYEVSVILGPAMAEFEREQAAWNAKVAQDKANRGYRCPSVVPLRGHCLVAYLTLMRPENNKALTWEEVKIDLQNRTGWFKLDQHKNVEPRHQSARQARERARRLPAVDPAGERARPHSSESCDRETLRRHPQADQDRKPHSRIQADRGRKPTSSTSATAALRTGR
jgi:hypothetical protein